MTWWVLSCPTMTVMVEVDATGIIRVAAPIVRTFIGQPLGNLLRWQRWTTTRCGPDDALPRA